jgi:thymidine kinase
MAIPQSQGYLEIIIGPMYSGKTSRLLTVYKQMRVCDVGVLVVNFVEDKRYSETMMATHDRAEIPCVFVERLSDLERRPQYKEKLDGARAVLINEGQFFADLYEKVAYFVETMRKQVYVCGLDGDYMRKPFGDLLTLIPLADNVIKLRSLCRRCKDGTPALFSHRIKQDVKEQKLIGSDAYTPVCRKCYQAFNT